MHDFIFVRLNFFNHPDLVGPVFVERGEVKSGIREVGRKGETQLIVSISYMEVRSVL